MIEIPDPVYGEIAFSGVLQKLLKTPPLQRLRGIHQGGAVGLVYSRIQTTRFEHSAGVCHLIRVLGGDLKEQIAGLLHDISHTAFSHVIDYVLDIHSENFHELHRERFLGDPELIEVLNAAGFEPNDFLEDDEYEILEASLPALCADRIDYTLRDLCARQKITATEARKFVEQLVFVDGVLAVCSIEWAVWFKRNYDFLIYEVFRDPQSIFAADRLSELLKFALAKGVLSIEDMFKDDRAVLDVLRADPESSHMLSELNNALMSEIPTGEQVLRHKARILDPTVLLEDKLVMLSEVLQ